MSMMRLFGYDVIATRAYDGKKIHNWADNASGRYIYVHIEDDIAPRFTINWNDLRKRQNSWMELPTLYGEVEFSYKLSGKALTWFSGDERICFASEPMTAIRRTEFQQVMAKMGQARPTVKIVPLHRRSDFYETRLSTPASRPTLAPVSSEMASAQPIMVGVADPDPAVEGLDPGDM